MLGVIFIAVILILGFAETYLWYAGLLWHDGPKEDPRNRMQR